MSAAQIKPCPFCGNGAPDIEQITQDVFAVVCNHCNVTGPIENYQAARQSTARAVELWNGRTG